MIANKSIKIYQVLIYTIILYDDPVSVWSVAARADCVVSCQVMSDCDLMAWRLPGSSVPGILQARMLEWVAISSPGDLRDPGTERRALHSEAKNCTAGGFFTTETPGKPWKQRSKYKKTDRVIWETYKCVCFMWTNINMFHIYLWLQD